jgi:glycosyltransferase involved in cell wall biosynthesis
LEVISLKITIVTYTFPPSNEIGGRRWAKLSQYLSKLGHDVGVICSDYGVDNKWYDSDFKDIDINTLPKNYPDWLNGINLTFKQKCFYHLTILASRLFSKNNIFDKSIAWETPLLEILETIYNKKGIDVLVMTGGPFSLLHYGTLFKEKHKEVKLVCDFRDQWTWGSLYGMENLPTRQKSYQEFQETRVMEFADIISYSTQSIGDYLIKKYPQSAQNLYLLPHAFDPIKFSKLDDTADRSGFIYGGTIYDGLEPIFNKLLKLLNKDNFNNFKWDIYTNHSYPLLQIEKAKSKIKLLPFIPEEDLFVKIKNAKAYLVFFPESEKDIISTKFCEIIYTQTPIIYVGEEGAVSKFIKEKKVGIHILPENIDNELPLYINGDVPVDFSFFDINQFSFPLVTKGFSDKLEIINSQ